MTRAEQRLRSVVTPRLEPGESFLAWAPAWVSREQRFHRLLASRNRDFAVLTDHRLMLWSTGFFSRLPRRRVLVHRLDEISITAPYRGGGRRLVCRAEGQPALFLELDANERAEAFKNEVRKLAAPANDDDTPDESDESDERSDDRAEDASDGAVEELPS